MQTHNIHIIMISKKYLGLFAIICTLGISTPGVLDVDAFSLQDTTSKIGLCFTVDCLKDVGHISEKVTQTLIAIGGALLDGARG